LPSLRAPIPTLFPYTTLFRSPRTTSSACSPTSRSSARPTWTRPSRPPRRSSPGPRTSASDAPPPGELTGRGPGGPAHVMREVGLVGVAEPGREVGEILLAAQPVGRLVKPPPPDQPRGGEAQTPRREPLQRALPEPHPGAQLPDLAERRVALDLLDDGVDQEILCAGRAEPGDALLHQSAAGRVDLVRGGPLRHQLPQRCREPREGG